MQYEEPVSKFRKLSDTENPEVGLYCASDNVELTEAELQTMKFVCIGLTNRQIAYTLKIKTRAVEVILHSIFIKFGVRNRKEAAKRFKTVIIF